MMRKIRVRVDFDIEAENYDTMKDEVYGVLSKYGNPVIQSPLCQSDFETKNDGRKDSVSGAVD